MGAAELAGERLVGGAQPFQPIVRVRMVAQNRSAFTFRQAAPHAIVSLGLESIGETFEANLAFIAAHTNLTLRRTLHKQHVRFYGRAERAGDPALVVALR
jgi:hypothetical protein